MKAIPTTYNGVKFKSKLEASWAQWFDENNIIWAYEVQGFDINGVWYLPDFWLPEIRTIVEVKGAMERIEKPFLLMKSLEKTHGWIQEQSPSYCPDDSIMVLLAGPTEYLYNINGWYAEGFCLVRCSQCRKVSIVTWLGSYACRACGFHNGDGDIISLHYPNVLCKPLEWLMLEGE